MKRQFLIIIIWIFILNSSYSQAWQWSNPKPTSNDLESSYFLDENDGYSVGMAGLIMKTTDGGITWNPLNSGTNAYLRSVFFINNLKGFCAGFDWYTNKAVLLKTENGGITWDVKIIDTASAFNQVLFIDSNNGFVIGSKGEIFKTNNGGSDWYKVESGTNYRLNSIYFIDSDTGWIGGWDYYGVGGHDGLALKTTDGGNSWSIISTGNTSMQSICFVNQSTGYSAGYYDIKKTIDGGITWTNITPNGYGGFRSVCTLNTDTVFVVGLDGIIFCSNDGGINWFPKFTATENDFNNIQMVNTNIGYIVGELGTVLKTQDGGNSWLLLSSGTAKHLTSIRFTDEFNGFCLINYGEVLKTTDAGATWKNIMIGDDYLLYSLCASSKTTLHFYGSKSNSMGQDSNFIFRSTDAGETWNTTYNEFLKPISSIFFIDSLNGYAVGYDALNGTAFLLKTNDGGAYWVLNNTFGNYVLSSVFFTDDLTGYIAGYNIIMKTVDGGQTWNSTTVPGNLNSQWYLNQDTGFAVGAGPNSEGIIIKTTDGGISWTSQSSNTFYSLFDITFYDNLIGYTVGYDGAVLSTTDCGISWNKQMVYSDYPFNSICSTGPTTAYIAGIYGTILKTTTGGIVTVEEKPITKSNKIFPNPTSGILTLELSTPNEKSYYSLYSINGLELAKGTITSYKTQIDISTLPKGVYFIRVTDQKKVTINKVIRE